MKKRLLVMCYPLFSIMTSVMLILYIIFNLIAIEVLSSTFPAIKI